MIFQVGKKYELILKVKNMYLKNKKIGTCIRLYKKFALFEIENEWGMSKECIHYFGNEYKVREIC